MKKPFLLALTFLLTGTVFYPAWAETKAPRLTMPVQRVVYKAQQAIEKNEYIKAEQYLKKYNDKHPRKPHYLVEFTLANLLVMGGKEREALVHYRTAANLYPTFGPAWQNMGKIHFDLKEYDQAGDCLLKAYETNEKKDLSLLYYTAVSYIMAKKEKKALPHLEHLVSGEAGPPKTEWLEALLKVCMDLKLKEKAFEVIHRLLDSNGDDPRWWKILAQFHLQQNVYKKALTALTIHSYLTSITREDIMLLGDLSSAIGIHLKAAGYYEKLLSLSSRPADYKKLASAYIAAHKPAKALDALNRALKKKPTSKLWFMMGQVLYEKEEFDKAYHAFDKCTRLNPKDGKSQLMMGYCALHVDKNETAKKAFQRATHFPKQRKTARKLLKQSALWSEK